MKVQGGTGSEKQTKIKHRRVRRFMVKIFLKMPTAHEPFDAAAALEG